MTDDQLSVQTRQASDLVFKNLDDTSAGRSSASVEETTLLAWIACSAVSFQTIYIF